MLRTPVKSRLQVRMLWLVLALPALWVLWEAGRPDADLDELTNISGQMAAMLLVTAIGITGAARLTGLVRLARVRRAFGLAAFGTSLVHLGLYFGAMGALQPIVAEFDAPGIWTGWASLLLLLLPALTSNDTAMRRLGRNWKRLQRLVWPAVALALAHTWIVHDGQSLAMALAAVLLILQLYRFNTERTVK